MAKSKLKKIGGLWKKARKTTKDDSSGDYINVEAGTYKMQLMSVSLGKFGAHQQFMFKWAVLDEDDRDATCTEFMKARDDEEQDFIWLQRLLIRLDVDVDDTDVEYYSDIKDIIQKELVDNNACAKIAVVASGEYLNIKVKKRIEVDEDELISDSEGEEEEEEGEDEFDGMSRKELKAYNKKNKCGVKVTTKMSDDDLRDAISEAVNGEEEEEEEEEEED